LVTTDFGGTADSASMILVEPNDTILLVGTRTMSGAHSFGLTRYNPDGSLDMGFGSGGKVTTAVGSAVAAALQGDGKIVVAGTGAAAGTTAQAFVLARYNQDGTLDAGFGTGGIVTTSFGAPNGDVAAGVAVQLDGKIIVAGNNLGTPPVSFSTIELARYNPDGSLDTSFGTGGKATSIGGPLTHPVLVESDGKILVAGTGEPTMTFPNDTSFFFRRFNPNGSVDTSFAPYVDLGRGPNGAVDAALQPDGKIVAVGLSAGRPVLVRLNPDGTMDAGFGVNGQVLTDFGSAVAVQPDGKILVAGAAGTELGIARFYPDGSLETRFGVAGTGTTAFVSQHTAAQDVTLQSDGKILVAGTVRSSGGNDSLALARFLGGPSDALLGTPTERFVRQVYLDLLRRPADPAGLGFWTGLVDQGQDTRAQVVLGIEHSPEFRTLVVQQLYDVLFNRAVDPSGQATWTNFLAQGGAPSELAAILMGSTEYAARNGDNFSNSSLIFVDALYRDVLHRYADSAGQQTWVQAVNSGIPRNSIATAFLGSLESDRDEVTQMYHTFLHRAPDQGGGDAYTSALQQGVSGEQVRAEILGSEEYFAQAQR
jgi:uncharacterized delta-60 repeat protein